MFSRLLSLAMAAATGWMLVYGFPIIGYKYQQADKHMLILVILGIIGGVVHGLGFAPGNIIFRFFFRWIVRSLMLYPLAV